MTEVLDFARRLVEEASPAVFAIDILLRVTMLLAAAVAVAVGLRRASAAVRHMVWTLALVSALAVPLATWAFPAWRLAVLPPPEAMPVADAGDCPDFRGANSTVVPEDLAAAKMGLSPSDQPGDATRLLDTADTPLQEDPTAAQMGLSPSARVSALFLPWFSVLAKVWLSGAVLGLAWLALAVASAWHVARRAKPTADSQWRSLLDQLRKQCGVRRPVAVLESTHVSVPMTWGMRRPVILVPAASAAWSDDAKRSVLLHELGHIRRRDCLVHLLGRLACAAYWFHPLVWLAAVQLRRASEQAADDVVLASNVAPPDYAEHLVGIAAHLRGLHLFSPVALPMASPSDLEGRVLAILDTKRSHASLRRRTCCFLMLLAVVLLIPCAVLRFGYAEENVCREDSPIAADSPGKEDMPVDAAPAAQHEGKAVNSDTATPSLRRGPARPAPSELVTRLLQVNRHWLRPDPQYLAYTFSMEHPGQDDETRAEVEYTAPSRITIRRESRPPHEGQVDDSYDPFNCAYPPRRQTLLQAVTLFGPLQELIMSPENHVLSVVGEETVDGVAAWVLHLTVEAGTSKKAIEAWDARLRQKANRSKYFYEFTPVRKEMDGKQIAVIEIKCDYEEGPHWRELVEANGKDPSEFFWCGCQIKAEIREYRGRVRPVIVFGGPSDGTVTSTSFLEGGIGNVTPKLGLGEGERIFDEKLYQELKVKSKEPELVLPMRVGCGVFGYWHGYSGGGAEVDQIWMDKATGRVLREEGFQKDKPSFTVVYSHFQPTHDKGQVPGQIVVTLLADSADSLYPWVFDMEFQLCDGKVWLLKSLKESQGEQKDMTTASVTNVSLSAADRKQPRSQISDAADGKAALAKPDGQPATPARDAVKGQGPIVRSGRVTDAQGHPIEGATVRVHCGRGTLFEAASTKTGKDGRYTLRFFSGGQYDATVFSAKKRGFAEKSGDGFDYVLVPAPTVDIELLDAENRPIAEKRLYLMGEHLPPACTVLKEGVTNASGQFCFEDVPPTFACWFITEVSPRREVRTPSMTFAHPEKYRARLRLRRDTPTDLDLFEVLSVKNAKGEEVREQVMAEKPTDNAATKDTSPPTRPKPTAPAEAPLASLSASDKVVDPTGKPVAQADLSLEAVIPGRDGQPVKWWNVTFWTAVDGNADQEADCWHDPVTGKSWRVVKKGDFTAHSDGGMTAHGLAPGVYRVYAAWGHSGAVQHVGRSDPIVLDGSKKHTTVEVPLMPGSTLAFRAVDAATGEPVLRPDVRVTSKSGHLPPNVQFSTPGSLMKIENVPPGAYAIRATIPAKRPDDVEYRLDDAPLTVEMVAGKDQEVVLPMRAARLTDAEVAKRWPWLVSGRVTDDQGRPVEGATVRAHCGYGTLKQTGVTETDKDGRYVLRFSPGMYELGNKPGEVPVNLQAARISVHKPGFAEKNLYRQGHLTMANRALPSGYRNWEGAGGPVLPNQPVSVDFVLAPVATIEVELFDAEGKDITDWGTTLSGKELPPSCSILTRGTRDASGRLLFEDVPTNFAWWFSMLVTSEREARSPSMVFQQPEKYHVRLQLRKNGPTGTDFLELLSVKNAKGEEVRERVTADRPVAGVKVDAKLRPGETDARIAPSPKPGEEKK